MAKEILLYGSFYSSTVVDFITAMEAAASQDVTLRINSPGGNPQDTWGAIAKFGEHKNAKKIKVDGSADSMALYFLCYADSAECLDVSTGVLHRASYGQWFEKSENITSADWASLKATNDKLRAAFEAKVDVKKFEALKGVTLDQVFAVDTRLDVELSAEDMLAIGLVSKINAITPALTAEITGYKARMAAESKGVLVVAEAKKDLPEPKKSNTMTLAELKASHPAVYAEIFNAGVTEERDRVSACLVYNEIDPKGVKAAIASGKPLTQTQMAEFALKQLSPEALKKMAEGNAPDVTTDKPDDEAETPAQKEAKKFAADLTAELGLGKK